MASQIQNFVLDHVLPAEPAGANLSIYRALVTDPVKAVSETLPARFHASFVSGTATRPFYAQFFHHDSLGIMDDTETHVVLPNGTDVTGGLCWLNIWVHTIWTLLVFLIIVKFLMPNDPKPVSEGGRGPVKDPMGFGLVMVFWPLLGLMVPWSFGSVYEMGVKPYVSVTSLADVPADERQFVQHWPTVEEPESESESQGSLQHSSAALAELESNDPAMAGHLLESYRMYKLYLSRSSWAHAFLELYISVQIFSTACEFFNSVGGGWKAKLVPIAHHVFSALSFGGAVLTGRLYFFALWLAMCEATNIFLNTLLISKTAGGWFGPWINKTFPTAMTLNGAFLWLSFLILRVISFPLWGLWFFQTLFRVRGDMGVSWLFDGVLGNVAKAVFGAGENATSFHGVAVTDIPEETLAVLQTAQRDGAGFIADDIRERRGGLTATEIFGYSFVVLFLWALSCMWFSRIHAGFMKALAGVLKGKSFDEGTSDVNVSAAVDNSDTPAGFSSEDSSKESDSDEGSSTTVASTPKSGNGGKKTSGTESHVPVVGVEMAANRAKAQGPRRRNRKQFA